MDVDLLVSLTRWQMVPTMIAGAAVESARHRRRAPVSVPDIEPMLTAGAWLRDPSS